MIRQSIEDLLLSLFLGGSIALVFIIVLGRIG